MPIAITELFAGIAVADYASMLAWYARLMGKPADFFPQQREAVWHVTEHGWLYIVADAERAGNGCSRSSSNTSATRLLNLPSVDSPLDQSMRYPGLCAKQPISDPEGNRITFGQPPT